MLQASEYVRQSLERAQHFRATFALANIYWECLDFVLKIHNKEAACLHVVFLLFYVFFRIPLSLFVYGRTAHRAQS